jgi:hypothetical protein
MGKLGWSLLILYLSAAGGYGVWGGPDLRLDWGVWCVIVPGIAPLRGENRDIQNSWRSKGASCRVPTRPYGSRKGYQTI